MVDFVERVAAAAALSTEQAAGAIGLVLAFLQREAPAEFDAVRVCLPPLTNNGASPLPDPATSAPLMKGLSSLMSGKSGGLMRLAADLSSLGLSTKTMATVGREIFAVAREHAGEERTRRVAAAVPGLQQLL